MDERVSGAFGVLRLLEERKAVVEAQVADMQWRIEYLEMELGTLRVAERELRKSLLPEEE